MGRNHTCDVCGSGLVANPKLGETRSNKESSIEYSCPNEPHEPDEESTDNTADIESLRAIGKKYGL